MGCEVVCPFLPGAKEVRWEIPDPSGKGIDEFRRVRDIIKAEVTELLTTSAFSASRDAAVGRERPVSSWQLAILV